MRFGVQHGIGDPRWTPAILQPPALASFARTAEAAGFEALAFTDHPSPSVRWIDAGGEGSADLFSALGFCAAVTTTIRLLTFVLVAAYRNPFLAAHQIATLDAISGGRVTVGLGTGYLKSEFRALGVDPETRREAFDAATDVLVRAWSAASVDAESPDFSARGVRVVPPVTQRPHPPLWIHGNSAWGTDRAARIGHGWLVSMMNDQLAATTRTRPLPALEDVARGADRLRDRLAAYGRRPDEVALVVAGAWPMLDIRSGWEPDRMLQRVGALRDLGVDWVMSTVLGDDPAAADDTARAFGEQVIALA